MAEQPKNFGFGEDETMLRDSARKFFEDHSTADKLHRLVAEDYRIDRPNECIWEPQLWQQMVELGWTQPVSLKKLEALACQSLLPLRWPRR